MMIKETDKLLKRMKKILVSLMLVLFNSMAVWSAMPDGFTFYTTTNGVSTAFTALPTAYRCAIGIAWNSTRRTSSSRPTEIGAGISTDYQGFFIIPSFLKDQAYYVTEIGYKAFYKCEGITGVTIPSSIKYIDYNAFNGCSGLTEVTIPGSVATIDGYAFACCHNLKTIKLNEGTQTIGENAFLACKSLTTLEIPASVKNIGSKAFGGSQIIHNGNGYGSYEGCDNLTKVIVHWETPITISAGTFSNAANCTLFVPKGKVETYANADVWKEFKSIKEYSPNIDFADATVKSICVANWDTDGDGELSEDEAAVVTSLERKFRKSNIQTFDELKFFTGLTAIYTEAFEDCSSLTTITIPKNVKSLDKQAFSRCYNLTNVSFPSGIETIGFQAFWNCTAFTSFDVPNGVKAIQSTAFEGCSNIVSISIPASVNSIGSIPFKGCSKLTSISVDNNNETYESPAGSNAIIERSKNKLVVGCSTTVIPASVLSIGNSAFSYCSLSSLIIPDKVTDIGNDAFSGSTLSSITGLKGLKTIGERTFYNCERLYQITLPANLTSIGSSAFEGCSALASIKIPSGITSIGSSVFYGCTSLKSATIEGTTIGYQQFYGCQNLETIVISNTVTSIGNYAFNGCKSLTSVNLPRSITSIGSSAFNSCGNLILVVSDSENPAQVSDNAFYGISPKARLQVPVGTKSKYQAIAGWNNHFNEIVDDDNTPKVLSLTIQVDGLGTVNYDGVSIRNKVSPFHILEGKSAVLSFNAENANGLKSVKVNNVDVTSNIANNQYTINAISSNSIVEVKFEYPDFSDGQTFVESYSYGRIEYRIISTNDKTCEVFLAYSDEDDGDFVIPASIYRYKVIGIAQYAFDDEDDMVSITIPPTITYIENGAFDEGGTVSDVYIYDLEAWCKIAFTDSYSSPTCGNLFLNGKKLIDVIIPNSITKINSYAFYGCSCIQSVTIPDGVIAIGKEAFSGCSLSNVTVMAATPIAIDATAFPNRSNAILYVPKGSKAAYQSANYWKEFKEIMEMEDAKVKLSKTKATMEKGKSGTLKATVYPETLADKSVTWKSSDTKVATVTSAGKVKAVGVGTAIITCTSNATGLSATCTLTVGKVVLSKTKATVTVGKSGTLKATVYPETLEDKSVTWKSSDTKVATVTSAGKVTAVGAGTAIITCTSVATGLSATCTLTVGKVVLSKSEATVSVGKSGTLKATVYPETLADKSVTWKSSDTDVATVTSAGKVTAVGVGTAVITCTSVATGAKATCTLTVGKVVLSKTKATVRVGKSGTLKATVYPETLADKSVTWKSSDKKVATVTSAGKVKAVGVGTAVITCTSVATGLRATCTLTVIAAAGTRSMYGDDDELTGIEEDMNEGVTESYDVYDLSGRKVRHQVTSLDGLPNGIYIVNGKKVLKK